MDSLQWSSQEEKSNPEKEGNKLLLDEKLHGIKCRRCSSSNTKFCYYNNYSLSQPRYFCKTCKRYWTEGGSLRNIPVGGVSRKRLRIPPPPPPDSSSSSKKMLLQPAPTPWNLSPPLPSPHPHQNHNNNNNIRIEGGGEVNKQEQEEELNLGLNPCEQSHNNVFKTITDLIQVPDFDNNVVDTLNNNNNNNNSNPNHYLFMPTTSIHHHHQLGSQEEDITMRRPAILFPFQEIKQVERKSSDTAAAAALKYGGFLGTGLW